MRKGQVLRCHQMWIWMMKWGGMLRRDCEGLWVWRGVRAEVVGWVTRMMEVWGAIAATVMMMIMRTVGVTELVGMITRMVGVMAGRATMQVIGRGTRVEEGSTIERLSVPVRVVLRIVL